MNIWQRLEAWFDRAKREDGLVDVKFYPGDRRDKPLRHAAEQLLSAGENRVDITEEKL